MKVIEHIQNSKNTLFSFELLPPRKGQSIKEIYDTIDPLIELKPAFIDVTYHREEIIYKEHKEGLLEKKIVKKRSGTVGIAAAIQFKYKIDVVPHIICGGFSKEETENALIDLNFLGIDNLLVVRGDADKTSHKFIPTHDGHKYAYQLINQIIDLNKGVYQDQELINTFPTNFSVGVAGYPEKHCEAPNSNIDLDYLKKKVDLGAEYIVTQMFYDNQKYFDFVKRCREKGINVPIIPGLKPISIPEHINILPHTFHIDLPDDLVAEINHCKRREDVRNVGIEWAIQQSKELIDSNVPAVHYYTMGKSDNIQQIAQAVF